MNIQEIMVAVISFLCGLEKARDYARGNYDNEKVAKGLGLAKTAVYRGMKLAQEYGLIENVQETMAWPGGPSTIYFSLTSSAHLQFEKRILGQDHNVATNIIIQFADKAIAQIGKNQTASVTLNQGIDSQAVEDVLYKILDAIKQGQAELPPDKTVELAEAVTHLREELGKPESDDLRATEAIGVIGSICSISSTLAPYAILLRELMNLG